VVSEPDMTVMSRDYVTSPGTVFGRFIDCLVQFLHARAAVGTVPRNKPRPLPSKFLTQLLPVLAYGPSSASVSLNDVT
jgi:hypothetical protein